MRFLLPLFLCCCLSLASFANIDLCVMVQTRVGEAEVFDDAYLIAKSLSKIWHKTHWLGSQPYAEHYDQVEGVLSEFGLTPHKDARSNRLHIAARIHDTIEDAGITKGEIAAMFGADIANLVDAVTFVRSRFPGDPAVDREAMIQTYEKILVHPDAIYLKLADRIANMRSYHSTGVSPKHYVDGQSGSDVERAGSPHHQQRIARQSREKIGS